MHKKSYRVNINNLILHKKIRIETLITQNQMKKQLLSIAILFFLLISCDNKKVDIQTNYYDLPDKHVETFKKIVVTDSLDVLTAQSIKVMADYTKSKILRFSNPVGGHGITSCYFWYIYNALPGFVDKKERHKGYYKNSNKQPFKEKLIAYAIYRLDRSSENLNKIFALAQPKLKEFIPVSVYKHYGIDKKVNHLLAVYKELNKMDGAWNKLSEFYAETYTPDGKVKLDKPAVKEAYNDGAYGFSSYLLSEMLCKKLGIDRFSWLYHSPALSFWMRRNHEGNVKTVHKILVQIKDMYQNKE